MTPEPTAATEVRLRRRVQFYETDASGMVHFSCYFHYMEEAEHALWVAAGLSNAPGDSIGWPRVAAGFEYHMPLRFEDEIEITLRIEEMTKRKIRYSCAISRDEDTVATGSLIVVCVEKQDGEPPRAKEIPPAIAARLMPR